MMNKLVVLVTCAGLYVLMAGASATAGDGVECKASASGSKINDINSVVQCQAMGDGTYDVITRGLAGDAAAANVQNTDCAPAQPCALCIEAAEGEDCEVQHVAVHNGGNMIAFLMECKD